MKALLILAGLFGAELPLVDDPAVLAALRSPKTYWYDDRNMPAAYQDPIPPIIGLRSPHSPVAPSEFFANGKFRFPFGVTAGTDDARIRTWKFLSLPMRTADAVWPVVVWREGLEYRWIYPVGAIVGEVLYLPPPDGDWIAFELRVRHRQFRRWETDVLRPLPTARHFAQALPAEETALIAWAADSSTIQPASLQGPLFESPGALDYLPPMRPELVKALLNRRFLSCNGEPWKTRGKLVCHAPISRGEFSIVPAAYMGGCVSADVETCTRCHRQCGEPIAKFDPARVLYGKIWGNDQVFSFHPLNPNATENDADYSVPENDLRREFFALGLVDWYDPAIHPAEIYQQVREP